MSAIASKPLKDLLLETKDGDWGQGDPAEGFVPYHVIRATDFASASLGDVQTVPLRFLPSHTVQRRTIQLNDVLIETAGGSPGRPTGRTMLITQRVIDSFEGPLTCASFARFLRADSEQIDSRYLYWFLQALYQSGEIEQYQVQHTGVARFQYTQFAATKQIPLPEMHVQQAIAEVLGALDDKTAANTKLVSLADELAASLTRFALDTTETVRLSEIAHVVMGSSPSGTSFNETGDGTVFYQGVRDFGVRFPSNRVWTTAPVRLAMPGDTLLSVRAPVGRVNLATEETCIGRGVASVRSSNDQPFTLFHVLKDSHEAWAPFEAEGTVFGSINKGQLASLRVPRLMPEHELQLEAKLEPLERVIASALAENSNLAATRDAFLPQLMSGKLRVKEAEAMVAAAV